MHKPFFSLCIKWYGITVWIVKWEWGKKDGQVALTPENQEKM